MYTRWTKGLTDQQKQDWYAQVKAAQPVLKKLSEIFQEDLNTSLSRLKNRDHYDKASWPYFVSDLLGEQRAYEKSMILINNLIEE